MPEYEFEWGPTPATLHPSPAKVPPDFSPPLIAMVVVIGTAFLIVTYFRLITRYLHRFFPPCHRFRRHLPPDSVTLDLESTTTLDHPETTFPLFSSYGLSETVIKTIPLSVYTNGKPLLDGSRDCAVCLLEFEDNDYLRILPKCNHAFHIDCIDIWLRAHASCPLCRTGILLPESPFIPVMASRIRPSLEDIILLETGLPETDTQAEIRSQGSPETDTQAKIDGESLTLNGRNCFLKRSYSFGFERSLMSEAVTASPWRYRRGSFWSKRFSPFTSNRARVFSFRCRGLKSPFFRRRSSMSTGFFPLSETNSRFSGGGSSRRSKSMTSPLFMRSAVVFSSSRLRCGDPEALLSPERLNRR